ncbi:MAG TPA: efflux RND transporter permease subunit [Phycisphaerae bacterium]|nr:efflux RND transporter permease subunit [Phycisphaerae bacterium]HRR86283.1 efflux RND transporter permease subunit [Phycisphaerae bacterium]
MTHDQGSKQHTPSASPSSGRPAGRHHGFTNAIVHVFLHSNLSLILTIIAAAMGLAALLMTPREEDPQIIVPLADVIVNCPGRSSQEIEQLVATPLEKILYQIDGVEYVYSVSRENMALITVRYFVGEDRERSLVKLYKKMDESIDMVPPGVTGWVVKPVEIDDVPIVTLTLTSATSDEFVLRRVGEELVERLAATKDVSRAYVIGGRSRIIHVYLDPERLQAHQLDPLAVRHAIGAANVTQTAGNYTRDDQVVQVEAGLAFARPEELDELVVGVFDGRPVFLRNVARIVDGPAEADNYVRHGWGPAAGKLHDRHAGGAVIGPASRNGNTNSSDPAVTIAIAKKKGSNAVWVARDVIAAAEALKTEVIPDDIDLVITRNAGLTSNEKVNELVEALAVAVLFVMVVLTLGLGWRESLIVAVAVPVVFGLTLAVNMMFGFTINRVTLFALILSLGLLVDDPIVDVENISRHFALRKRAARHIVLEAVAEIRPPLITATLAVIVSFLPMFFITGMMGPYMRPMALNVPVAMLMSMVVAFTITPWLSYHVLGRHYNKAGAAHTEGPEDDLDSETIKKSPLYRLFHPLMAPLLHKRWLSWTFLGAMGALTVGAMMLAVTRHVPLKMLPFDNKNELQLVLDFDEGTTLERSDAAVRDFEDFLRTVPEVTDFTSYVGIASPMDFNGLVRQYYMRRGDNVAEVRINLVGKKSRKQQSHGISLRLRDDLTGIASRHNASLKIVETPPGPPVIASIVAEVYGRPANTYEDLIAAARTVRTRMEMEPGVVDVDDTVEADSKKLIFVTDKEKAALNGITVAQITETLRTALEGASAGTIRTRGERHPLEIVLRLPRAIRSDLFDLSKLHVRGEKGQLVPLAELGRIERSVVDKSIYHKNLRRVVYVFAETAGRPPADCVVDIQSDKMPGAIALEPPPQGVDHSHGFVKKADATRPVAGRTFLSNGSGIKWWLPDGYDVDFAGEGEWKITLDVFRDLGLAFVAALIGIYILLVGQTKSFVIPVVVMLAIPLTVLGIMPGFWLLNLVAGSHVGQYADAIFFTATGMIGMIALAGIVTRDSIILVDFIHLSLAKGRSLFDAIMESRVVRLRPILLTAGTALLSALPITIDPIFSGLAWSLIFGLVASTIFTLFVIPVTYWLLYANKPGHGLPATEE